MAAAKVTEVRAGFNPEQWKSWRLPTDKSNPAQLKRIVSEWAEQREILATLETIDSNPSRAIGILLQSHSLLKNAQVVVRAEPVPVATESPVEAADEFEDNTDEF